MIDSNFKKHKEFQSILPLMERLGYDTRMAEKSLIPSERPDFILKTKDKIIGIEVTECHPEITKGKNGKNKRAAKQRTSEICRYIEQYQDVINEVVNYSIGFNFTLLFDLQKPSLKKIEKETIRNKVLSELQRRIKKGDYIKIGNGFDRLSEEWSKDYHYIRDIVIDDPLEKSIVTYSYPARGLFPIEQDIVINTIAKKETKIESYRKEHPIIKEFWLCVNIPMEAGRTIDNIQGLKVKTQYDRVFLTSYLKCVSIK